MQAGYRQVTMHEEVNRPLEVEVIHTTEGMTDRLFRDNYHLVITHLMPDEPIDGLEALMDAATHPAVPRSLFYLIADTEELQGRGFEVFRARRQGITRYSRPLIFSQVAPKRISLSRMTDYMFSALTGTFRSNY